ncbi:MAG: PHP domain-containing protein [Gammaproteobacteria bacterium]|nr:PHP domain-containing protein [Gammaproteobacteria bacterium]
MNFDLHNHSHFSDGKHSPEFVLNRARQNGVSHLALTDHDCIEGNLELRRLGIPPDIQLISGVEISTVWNNTEIHVVGLCIDPAHPGLQLFLKNQQKKRWLRIQKMQLAMEKNGIGGLTTFLENCGCVSPGRSHVAEFLIRQGKARSHKKAFKSLARNGRYFAAPQWCEIPDAIAHITEAGGLAVLAHPHRYPLSNGKLKRLIQEFKQFGGAAMEVSYSNVSNEVRNLLGTLCMDTELYASIGSDFHDANAKWMDIGRLQALPEMCIKNAIWLHPRWHL